MRCRTDAQQVSIKLITWVLEHSEATLGSRLVLIALADVGHDDGSKCFPAVETIAAKSRMSRKAVQVALRKLETERHIEATGRTRNGTIIYTIRGVDSSPVGGEDTSRRGEATSSRGEDTSRVSGEDSSPKPFNRQDPLGNLNGSMPEPMGFEEWLAHHCEVTGQTPPGGSTKARAELARKYGALTGEGRSLDDMKLASVGAHADSWRREHSRDFPRNVLVSEQIDELIEKGRRAAKGSDKPKQSRFERKGPVKEW
jgi:hypothetical protein